LIKKNNYIRDLNDEEIEEIKYYKRFFKKISNELEDIDYIKISTENIFSTIYIIEWIINLLIYVNY
jgi:hypothetical protein